MGMFEMRRCSNGVRPGCHRDRVNEMVRFGGALDFVRLPVLYSSSRTTVIEG